VGEGDGEVVAIYEGDVVEGVGFVLPALEGDFEECCWGVSLLGVRIVYYLYEGGETYSNSAV
jgi:hypothetical protein